MEDVTPLPADCIPKLGTGMKFRFDRVRDAWVLLGPERMFVPDQHAVEILQLLDGTQNFAQIVDTLAAKFAAPADVIATDVTAMLQDLAARGAVKL